MGGRIWPPTASHPSGGHVGGHAHFGLPQLPTASHGLPLRPPTASHMAKLGGPIERPNWEAVGGHAGDRTRQCEAELGGHGRPNWQAEVGGRSARPKWGAELGGRSGRPQCEAEVGGRGRGGRPCSLIGSDRSHEKMWEAEFGLPRPPTLVEAMLEAMLSEAK